jgi:enoyl-CoA hydratase/carnithine racemase
MCVLCSSYSGMMIKFYNLFLCLRKLPVPIIAAINGPAVGAGLCVAAACDVIVASPTANMGRCNNDQQSYLRDHR